MLASGAHLRWILLSLSLTTVQRSYGDESAAEIFRKGSEAYARGEFAVAAAAFARASATRPHGDTSYNEGLAWESAGDLPRAADAHAAALARTDLSPSLAKDARARLARLERQLGLLDVAGPGAALASVDRSPERAVPFRAHVLPGAHRVDLRYPTGEQASEQVSVAAGAVVAVSFLAVPPAPTAAASTSAPVAPEPPPPPPREPPPPSSLQRVVGFVSLGTGVVVLGASLFVGSRALAARDDYNASGHTDLTSRDRAASLRTLTNVGLGVAGGLALGGVVLLLTSPSAPQVSLQVTPSRLLLGASF